MNQERSLDRIKSLAGVAAFHLLLGYMLVHGLSFAPAVEVDEKLKMFKVAENAPDPKDDAREEVPAKAAESEDPARENVKAVPAANVALPAELRIETPSMAAAPVTGEGSDVMIGAGDAPGAGTGSGDQGNGFGGDSGGAAQKAQRESGALTNTDYPRAAARVKAAGTVFIRFVVGTDGRVRGCTVTVSSGNADLDSITCRLVEQRFHYRPARDARGNPVEETLSTNFTWEPRY